MNSIGAVRGIPPTAVGCAAVVLVTLWLLTTSAWSDSFGAKVIGITDGDTLLVLRAQTQIKLRLDGIDAPESGQAFGKRAKQAASALAFGREVTVQPKEHDRYGRLVARIVLPDGRSLNQELVRQGWAWWFRRYAPNDRVLETLEGEAREAGRGLWADPKPVPPWDWRKAHRKLEAAVPRRLPAQGRVTGADPTPITESPPIVANRRSRLYHTPGCRTYEATSLQNRELFSTVANAEAAGYRRAGTCR
jgi:micrococcal nuclease